MLGGYSKKTQLLGVRYIDHTMVIIKPVSTVGGVTIILLLGLEL